MNFKFLPPALKAERFPLFKPGDDQTCRDLVNTAMVVVATANISTGYDVTGSALSISHVFIH